MDKQIAELLCKPIKTVPPKIRYEAAKALNEVFNKTKGKSRSMYSAADWLPEVSAVIKIINKG